MQDQRNLLLAILISLTILLGYDYFFPKPQAPTQSNNTTQEDALAFKPEATPQQPSFQTPEKALEGEKLVPINTQTIEGSINLRGGRFNHIILKDYKETLDEDSPNVTLFSPAGTQKAYFANLGWLSSDSSIQLPNKNTLWQVRGKELSENEPLILEWTSPQNITFIREITYDNAYLFDIKQKVINRSGKSLTLTPYALIARGETPETSGYAILHEGPIGVLNDKLKEFDYEEVQKKKIIQEKAQSGWIGFTDKYWLSALIPDSSSPFTARVIYQNKNNQDYYQTDYYYDAMNVPAGGEVAINTHLFTGPKSVHLLDRYEQEYHIDKFDRAIDFGWFYFLTKPFFNALVFINSYVGNFGVSILIFTIFLKILLFPLANKSYKAMSRMKQIQPQMMRLREQYKADPMQMNKKVMELYKKEKVNPMSGCLPILIQIPIFFALYKVLFVTIEMRHAPFFGWIHDLSAPDPTSIFNLFGLIPIDPPSFLMIGAWPIIMGITMYLQQKLNPAPQDPMQAKIFMALPFVFTFLLARFPAGLVIYWAWNNSLSILQQWLIMRSMKKNK